MRAGVVLFRAALCVGWLALFWVTIGAARRMGVNAAGTVFFGDFAHPWRAQFNTDFSLHLLLVAAWMIYRSRSWFVGIVCALLAINLGGLFTLAYILVASIRTGGDVRALLLGDRQTVPGIV